MLCLPDALWWLGVVHWHGWVGSVVVVAQCLAHLVAEWDVSTALAKFTLSQGPRLAGLEWAYPEENLWKCCTASW